MTTPYLKDTNPERKALTARWHEELTDMIESGDTVVFTGAYDSAGTAIYDGDVLFYKNYDSKNKTFSVFFDDRSFQWNVINQDGDIKPLVDVLRLPWDYIVQPTADRDEGDDMEAKIKNITQSRDQWKHLYALELEANKQLSVQKVKDAIHKGTETLLQMGEVITLGGGDTAVKPKYQVEFTGRNSKGFPVFNIGCNTESYMWFINHWAEPEYSGSLTPEEIKAQRVALIDALHKLK